MRWTVGVLLFAIFAAGPALLTNACDMESQTPLPEWKDIYVLTAHRIAELERDPTKFTVPKHPVPVVAPMGQW